MQDAARKPIEDIEVSTIGSAEDTVQQNGSVVHNEASYIPQVESEIFPRAPVINSPLPKTVVISDRGRFIIECCVSGFPKPKGKDTALFRIELLI